MDKEEVGLVLQRAEVIEHERSGTDADELLKAAVEAGLSREAVEQALREHMALQESSMAIGDLVFAPSTDGFYYVARVMAIEGELVNVCFVSGSERRLLRSKLRPFSLLPGQLVSANWPNWGWWNCRVVSYDQAIHSVKLSDGWGSELSFTLSNVRLPQERPASSTDRMKTAIFLGAIALVSGSLGAIVTWLLMRG